MRKSLSFLFITLFSLGVVAQNAPTNPTAYTIYNGQDYMPRLFEPYQADYVFKGKGLGLTFSLFEFSANIVERPDYWAEEIAFRLGETLDGKIEDFPETIYITNEIDLKTGTLRNMTGQTTMPGGEKVSSRVEFGAGEVTISGWLNGKLAEKKAFPLNEKIYPCSMSLAFFSYLPLKEGFAGEFKCFGLDDKDNLEINKRYLRVVGSETITTNAGTFDAFKLIDDGETAVKIKDKKKTAKLEEKYGLIKYFSSLHAATWIDKRTRQLVKSEVDFKKLGGKLVFELKKTRRSPNL